MKALTSHLEVISPCFCGGAEPEERAEIRAASIRGQLRWWFRTLGGFKSLSPKMKTVREQEDFIFGTAAGENGSAGKLIVRVLMVSGNSETVTAAAMGAGEMNSPIGYILFPLRPTRDEPDKRRGAYRSSLPKFDLNLLWRGEPNLVEDIEALVAVFGHLGSLGFRSRRAMGALAFVKNPPDLKAALEKFTNPAGIEVRQLKDPVIDAQSAIVGLARWLKGWRSHGRTSDHGQARPSEPPHNSGFPWAKKDHDAGLGLYGGPVYRAALGLPIIQFYSTGRRRANWDFDLDPKTRKAKGRFASPVILRPYKSGSTWKALVIFVETHKWPAKHQVQIDGRGRAVSLDLYIAMKGGLVSF